MLEIIICEDNEKLRKSYAEMIDLYAAFEELSMKVVLSTENPYEVLQLINDKPKSRFYFLDIDLKTEMNGIRLGAEIRKRDLAGFIVYVTAHPELTYLNFTHRVGAIDFIVKSDEKQMKESFQKIMRDVWELYKNVLTAKRRFQINTKGMTQFIDYDDIIMVETEPSTRKLVIFTKHQERIAFTGSLKAFEKLDGRFFYYNRSLVLNVNHIAKIEKTLILSNGEELPVTRSSMKRLKGLENTPKSTFNV